MIRLILPLILFAPLAAADTAVDVQMQPNVQDTAHILNLQKSMLMSANVQELSPAPQIICFKTNIVKFLPATDTNPKTIYGCIFSDQVTMDAALAHSGLVNAANKSTAQSPQGLSLERFQKLNAIEKQFNKNVTEAILSDDDSNFLFFALLNTSQFKTKLSNELLKAQYQDIPQMSAILREVWQHQVSAEDKQTISTSLVNYGYDVQQEDALLREFYANLLQYDASNYLNSDEALKPMSPLVAQYSPLISKALSDHGITILTLN